MRGTLVLNMIGSELRMGNFIKFLKKIRFLLIILPAVFVISDVAYLISGYFNGYFVRQIDFLVNIIFLPLLAVVFFTVPFSVISYLYKNGNTAVGDTLFLAGAFFTLIISIALFLTVLFQGYIMYAALMPAAFEGCILALEARVD